MKKVLVIPDSTWGEESGHRSTQFLAKTLAKKKFFVGVYTDFDQRYERQIRNLVGGRNIEYIEKTPYRFSDHIPVFRRRAKREFFQIINEFNPDVLVYFGTLGNKVSIDYLLAEEVDIPYYYIPLTNEFWCFKGFAGLAEGECFKCMSTRYIHAVLNGCFNSNNPIKILKDMYVKFRSKRRFLNAERVVGYSKSQIDTFLDYGLRENRSAKTNIYFDRETLNNSVPEKGDYFLILGQMSTAKGWQHVPEIVTTCVDYGVPFKIIIYKEKNAKEFVNRNNLHDRIQSGMIQVISNLQEHGKVIDIIARSFAVVIPTNYPTTGEFILLEAMGLRKPIVAFDVGIHRDILVHGKNALVSSVGDVETMNRNVLELHSGVVDWEQLSEQAFQTYQDITEFDHSKNQFIELLTL